MNFWGAILLCLLCYLWGYRLGQGKEIVYIGTDKDKYKKALLGILLKPKS